LPRIDLHTRGDGGRSGAALRRPRLSSDASDAPSESLARAFKAHVSALTDCHTPGIRFIEFQLDRESIGADDGPDQTPPREPLPRVNFRVRVGARGPDDYAGSRCKDDRRLSLGSKLKPALAGVRKFELGNNCV